MNTLYLKYIYRNYNLKKLQNINRKLFWKQQFMSFCIMKKELIKTSAVLKLKVFCPSCSAGICFAACSYSIWHGKTVTINVLCWGILPYEHAQCLWNIHKPSGQFYCVTLPLPNHKKTWTHPKTIKSINPNTNISV